ncbi:MAG: DUF1491 family protein [Alphaproteobacteria bacterium]|nr:DUF1491 family protein [Alphaproteobacteria bacterium]
MDNRPSTDLYVSAHARIAEREGVPMTVVHKGDPSSGTIVLKINLLNGTARVLIEVRKGDKRAWMPALASDPATDHVAEEYLSRQVEIDPDVWVVEIEDKKGRVWFPEEVVRI